MSRNWLSPLCWLLLGSLRPAAADGFAPLLTWQRGEFAFRCAGTPRLVVGRNPIAVNAAAYAEHFRQMAAAGETLARIHFCFLPPDEPPGTLQPGLLAVWDAALEAAERAGVAVIPVLGVWSDWNDGSGGAVWHAWDRNPYNLARGGPARSPAELLTSGACRTRWLARLTALVAHWQARRCIVGWESFSELDLVTGADEAGAVDFAGACAAAIRAADPAGRPLTCSLSAGHDWPLLGASGAVDLVQVHPYGSPGQSDLDELILTAVRAARARYGKPVLLGECGLDWRPPKGTLDTTRRAEVGLRQAVWAAVVSGALNARMFWWQDGYDQFEGADLTSRYQHLAAPAAAFVKELDWSGLAPVEVELSPGLRGAALAAPESFVAWVRDARCQAPNWPTAPTRDQWLALPARAGRWQVEVVATDQVKVPARREVRAEAGRLRLGLEEFGGSVGVRGRWVGG